MLRKKVYSGAAKAVRIQTIRIRKNAMVLLIAVHLCV